MDDVDIEAQFVQESLEAELLQDKGTGEISKKAAALLAFYDEGEHLLRNTFYAWHREQYSRKLRMKSLSGDIVRSLAIEKACTETMLTSVFRGWAYARTVSNLENNLHDLRNRVQNWQSSYGMSKNASSTAIGMFLDTAVGKASREFFMLSIFKSWSHSLDLRKLEARLEDMAGRIQNWRCSYDMVKHGVSASVDLFLGKHKAMDIVIEVYVSWSRLCAFRRLETRLSGSEKAVTKMTLEVSRAKAAELIARRLGDILWASHGPPSVVMLVFRCWTHMQKISSLSKMSSSPAAVHDLRMHWVLRSAQTSSDIC